MKKKKSLWRFTEYNLSEERRKFLGTVSCRFICWGEKTHPKTKRKHLQGFVWFKSKRYMNVIIKMMKPTHIHPCNKNFREQLNYCRKELRNFVEFGDGPKQGKRTDLKKNIDGDINEININEIKTNLKIHPSKMLKHKVHFIESQNPTSFQDNTSITYGTILFKHVMDKINYCVVIVKGSNDVEKKYTIGEDASIISEDAITNKEDYNDLGIYEKVKIHMKRILEEFSLKTLKDFPLKNLKESVAFSNLASFMTNLCICTMANIHFNKFDVHIPKNQNVKKFQIINETNILFGKSIIKISNEENWDLKKMLHIPRKKKIFLVPDKIKTLKIKNPVNGKITTLVCKNLQEERNL